MNWTEGKLARHSRARRGNKQTAIRQKEHFAKARAGHASHAARSPPSFSSFFPSPAARISQPVMSHPPLPVTRTLSGSQDCAPAGKRRRSSSPSGHHGESILPLPGLTLGMSHGENQQQRPSASATGIDDIDFLERRRKLLRNYDWAGIQLQKPIPVSFNDDTSGRKWSRCQGAKDVKHRHVLRDRHGTARKDNDPKTTSHRHRGVKITIGSQQVRVGDPYSTARTSHVSSPQQEVTMRQLGLKPYRGMPMRSTFVGSSPSVPETHDIPQGLMGPPKRHPSVITISDSSPRQPTENVRRGHGSLHAPIPVRRFPDLELSLTQRAERDEADSVLAQVGMQTSPLPSERQEENEVWRKWAALRSTTGSVKSRTALPRISPGMSAHHQHALPSTASQVEPSVYDNADLSSSGQMSSYASRQLDDVSSIPEGYFGDHQDLRNQVELHSQSQDTAIQTSSLRSPSRPSEVMGSQWESSHDSSSRAADSPDQYLAGVHDLALKVVSQHLSRRNEKAEEGLVSGRSIVVADDNTAGVRTTKYEDIRKDNFRAVNTSGAITARTPENDPHDLWYSFVFSDANTEDLHREVLAEAQKDIKSGGGMDKTDQSAWGRTISNAATVGQPSVSGTSMIEDDLASVPEACASHTTALGSSMITQTSDPTFHGSDLEASRGPIHAAPRTYAETAPSRTISPGRLPTTETTFTDGSTVPESSEATTHPASLAVEPPQSVRNPAVAGESFIFAPPKLFVGRLADTRSDRGPTAHKAKMPLTTAKPRRGRPRNKSRDGRLDIRSIPRYEDDPIEDFDELEVETRMQPSLFGSLETE